MMTRPSNVRSITPRWCWLFLASLGFAATSVLAAAAQGTPAPGAAAPIFHWRPFLAPFHAVVLHFPIGFVTTAFLLESYRVFRPSEDIRRVTVMILWLGLLTGIVSAAFGWLRAGSGEYDATMLERHRIFGISVPIATLLVIAAQWIAHRRGAQRGWTLCYRACLAGTIGLVGLAGHQGGNLTHGSKYLVENAPMFIREFLEGEENPAAKPGVTAVANSEQARVYTEKVQPILSAKCYSCHGPEKQKAGLRLDKPEVALKGGDSGKPGIKPGDAIESHIVQLILLPPNHDDVMPPEGKKPLTPDEIMTIINWIRNGAVFPESGQVLTATNNAG